jgi:hypothetical protein
MITITPYQIVVPLFSLLMITYAWNLVMRQKKSLWEGLLWTIFWAGIGCIAIVPSSLQYLSTVTGIQNNENAATFTAIVVLFFILFYIIVRLEEIEQRLTKIVRTKALNNAGINDHSSHT